MSWAEDCRSRGHDTARYIRVDRRRMKTAGSVGPSVERFQSRANMRYGLVLAGVHPDAPRPIAAAYCGTCCNQFLPLPGIWQCLSLVTCWRPLAFNRPRYLAGGEYHVDSVTTAAGAQPLLTNLFELWELSTKQSRQFQSYWQHPQEFVSIHPSGIPASFSLNSLAVGLHTRNVCLRPRASMWAGAWMEAGISPRFQNQWRVSVYDRCAF